ncbi:MULTISPECIES: hypothetical protein [unclassified Xanthobacter]|uniref:hypothetical protein n=1 Tax=unclassified Xanthobacter TaxID=2623496 RepID=UPI001F48B94D|nr:MULTISPECIES: hypothetical protein [unclassified Xanthobacter]
MSVPAESAGRAAPSPRTPGDGEVAPRARLWRMVNTCKTAPGRDAPEDLSIEEAAGDRFLAALRPAPGLRDVALLAYQASDIRVLFETLECERATIDALLRENALLRASVCPENSPRPEHASMEIARAISIIRAIMGRVMQPAVAPKCPELQGITLEEMIAARTVVAAAWSKRLSQLGLTKESARELRLPTDRDLAASFYLENRPAPTSKGAR